MTELFVDYKTSVVALLILLLSVLIQSFLSAFHKTVRGGLAPGMPAGGGHEDLTFRTYRSHMNSLENLSVFLGTALLAILVGASTKWVNFLVVMHVAARLAYWLVYVRGYGEIAGGLRTQLFVAGWGINIALLVVTGLAIL